MSSAQTLATLALRRLGTTSPGEAGGNGHGVLPLVKALQTASEWTWNTLEIMLAGQRLCEQAEGADPSFGGCLREAVTALLAQVAPEEFRRADPEWRQLCWQQLRAAHQAGMLDPEPPNGQGAGLPAEVNGGADRRVLERLAGGFERSGWYCLRPLLEMRAWQGDPFCVALLAWFTRKALGCTTAGLPLDSYEWDSTLDLLVRLFQDHKTALDSALRGSCGEAPVTAAAPVIDTMAASLRFQRGLGLIQNGDHERAIPEFTAAIQHNPAMEHAHAQRGDAHRLLGAAEQALADYTAAHRLNPANALVLINRGQTYRMLGRLDEAIADYDLALQLNPDNLAALNHRGNTHADLGDHQAAIGDFTQALQLDPNYPFSYQNRARSHAALGDLDAAIADYGQVLRLNPMFTLAYVRRGDAYRQKGERDRAIADYTDALRLDPLHLQAYVNRGGAYQEQGQPVRAMADFEAALKLDRNNPRLYLNRGIMHRDNGNLEQALDDFDTALQLDVDNPEIFFHRALAYELQGDTEQAIDDLDEMLRLKPDAGDGYFHRGTLRVMRREPDEALADLDEAIRLEPRRPRAYLSRALAHALTDSLDEAIGDCTQALALDSSLARAYLTRGTAYYRQGDNDRARSDFDRLLQINPADPEALINRAIVHNRTGAHQAAIADCTRALQAAPQNARAFATRAASNRAQNRHQEALADFAQAALHDPKYSVAYNNQRGLLHAAQGAYDLAIADCALTLMLEPGNRRALRLREQVEEARRQQKRPQPKTALLLPLDAPQPAAAAAKKKQPGRPAAARQELPNGQPPAAAVERTEPELPGAGTYELTTEPEIARPEQTSFELDLTAVEPVPLRENTEVELSALEGPAAAAEPPSLPAPPADAAGQDANDDTVPESEVALREALGETEDYSAGSAADEEEFLAEQKRLKEAQEKRIRDEKARTHLDEQRRLAGQRPTPKKSRPAFNDDNRWAFEIWKERAIWAGVAVLGLFFLYSAWGALRPYFAYRAYTVPDDDTEKIVATGKVSAGELSSQYQADPARAEAEFGQRILEVTGIVKDVKADKDKTSILLQGDGGDASVVCNIAPIKGGRQALLFSRVENSSVVIIKGTCLGKEGNNVTLKDVRLVSARDP